MFELVKGAVEEVKLKGHDLCLKLTSTQNGEKVIFLSFNSAKEYERWKCRCKKVRFVRSQQSHSSVNLHYFIISHTVILVILSVQLLSIKVICICILSGIVIILTRTYHCCYHHCWAYCCYYYYIFSGIIKPLNSVGITFILLSITIEKRRKTFLARLVLMQLVLWMFIS